MFDRETETETETETNPYPDPDTDIDTDTQSRTGRHLECLLIKGVCVVAVCLIHVVLLV